MVIVIARRTIAPRRPTFALEDLVSSTSLIRIHKHRRLSYMEESSTLIHVPDATIVYARVERIWDTTNISAVLEQLMPRSAQTLFRTTVVLAKIAIQSARPQSARSKWTPTRIASFWPKILQSVLRATKLSSLAQSLGLGLLGTLRTAQIASDKCSWRSTTQRLRPTSLSSKSDVPRLILQILDLNTSQQE